MTGQKRIRFQLRLSPAVPTRQAVVDLFRQPEFRGYGPSVGTPSADGRVECWITVPAYIDEEQLIFLAPLNQGADLEGGDAVLLQPARGDQVNSGTLDALALGKPLLG